MSVNYHIDRDDDLLHLSNLKNYKVKQVTTHGHDKPILPLLPTWKEFKGTMHRDYVAIPPQSEWYFPLIEGAGKIINIWLTAAPPIDFNLYDKEIKIKDILRNRSQLAQLFTYSKFPNLLRKVWIEIFFDDENEPSVCSPLGDFFGVGFGEYKPYISRYLMMTAGGYVCQFHMPFKKNARVIISNRNETLWVPAFYGAVTYLIYPDGTPLEHQGYFHAIYREEQPTTAGKPYLILDTRQMSNSKGKGHYVGVMLNTMGTSRKAGFYFLEGNTKMWVDGEEEPSLEYTGLEDYYQGAWYYTKTKNRSKTEFYAPYHGLTVKSLNKLGFLGSTLLGRSKKMKLSQYRFHPDGIPFEESIRITVHHGEFDEVECNFSSVAYWYQTR